MESISLPRQIEVNQCNETKNREKNYFDFFKRLSFEARRFAIETLQLIQEGM